MILNSHNVLCSSLDYVHMEVYVRFISDSFCFISDSFFWKFYYDRTLITILVQIFKMLVKTNCIKLSLELCFLLRSERMFLTMVMEVIEKGRSKSFRNHNFFSLDISFLTIFLTLLEAK